MNAPQHDSQHTKQFFDRWHLYQQIIGNDYMAHRGIHAALRQFVMAKLDQPFTLLDLGCGDASAIADTFAGSGLQAYTGVDLSPVALEQAARNLAAAPFEVDLVEGDFTHYLSRSVEPFNVILAGFALHHLYPDEKREFFKRCAAVLTSPGYVLLYDLFRRPGETREDYIQAYCQHCHESWTDLSQEGLAAATAHVNQCDFPETHGTLARMASESGFAATSTPLFTDAAQFHCLYVFQKNFAESELNQNPAALP